MRRLWVAVAIVGLVALGCGKPKGQDAEPGTVGAGRICDEVGQTAGHGGQVYECVKLPDGRLVWERQIG